jgi:type IV pilus assembly protein PilC
MKFTYDAFDASGKPATGTVEAADLTEAVDVLSRQGLYVAHVKPEHAVAAAGAAAAESKGWFGGGRRLTRGRRLKNLAMFFRQLNVLVSSGTPLVPALGSLERQAKEPAWRDIVGTVRAKVEEGATLAVAMESSPQTFDAVCRSLIAAGESGGGFEQMLDRLATLTKKQMQLRSAIVGALIYPTLLIIIAINVLCTMLLFVLPRFTGLFASLDVPLPPTTKFLMALSEALRTYWWGALLGIAATVVGLWYWVRTPAGKQTVDTILLKLPGVGQIVRSFSVARITRVLGVLVNGKVPLLEALGLARQTVRNTHFMRLVARAEDGVTRGSSVSAIFGESDLVNPTLVEAIRSGEQSGQLGSLLLNIADFLDEENEVVVKSLTSILEPVILIGLGLVVGFIAISMFLPLFDLTSMARGGV